MGGVARAREIERERGKLTGVHFTVYVCLCVCERERAERESACEREGAGDGVGGGAGGLRERERERRKKRDKLTRAKLTSPLLPPMCSHSLVLSLFCRVRLLSHTRAHSLLVCRVRKRERVRAREKERVLCSLDTPRERASVM